METRDQPRRIADAVTWIPAGHTSARAIPLLACGVYRQQKPVSGQGRELGHSVGYPFHPPTHQSPHTINSIISSSSVPNREASLSLLTQPEAPK